MLIEKITINVGESESLYIEIYSGDTPVADLKYGDVKFDKEDKLCLWYGSDSTEMSGWCTPPWETNSVSNAVIINVRENTKHGNDAIYRILNNDLSFDEEAYKKELGVTYEH